MRRKINLTLECLIESSKIFYIEDRAAIIKFNNPKQQDPSRRQARLKGGSGGECQK